MKIAITATGKDLDSNVDPRFGRAMYFIVIDSESGDFEVLPNEQNLNAAQGAGIQSAQNVVNTGCKVAISGHFGPKAFSVLGAAGVKAIPGATGTVREVLEQYRQGKLNPAAGPDVEGHW